jgi:hypothetical protein
MVKSSNVRTRPAETNFGVKERRTDLRLLKAVAAIDQPACVGRSCKGDQDMKMSHLMTKVSLGVALAGTLAVAMPSASYAFGEHQYYYANDDADGTVWDYYRGYFSNDSDSTRDAARPRAQTRSNNNTAPRRNATTPSRSQDRPSCMVGSDGGCR